MMYYLLFVLAYTIIFGSLIKKVNIKESKARRIYCVSVFILLFLFAALRGENVGIDTTHRYRTFNNMKALGIMYVIEETSVEVGYAALSYLLSLIFTKAWMSEVVYAAIILGIHIWFYYRYSNSLPYALALFIIFNYSSTMNTTRQYLAISIVLIGVHYIIRKRWIPAVIALGAATLFHTSAIMTFALLPFAFERFTPNRKMFLALIPVSLAAIASYSGILELLLILLPRYRHYINSTFYGATSRVSIPWLVIYTALAVLIVLRYRKDEKRQRRLKSAAVEETQREFGIFAMMFLLYAVCDITSFFFKAIYRIMRYFYVGFTIVLPESAVALFKKNQMNRLLFAALFLAVALVIGYVEFTANKYRLFPYTFFWNAYY